MIDDLIGYVKTYENVKVDNKIKRFLRDNRILELIHIQKVLNLGLKVKHIITF